MMAQYRIVRDTYNGYEVQVRRWWFPVWVQLGFCNTPALKEQRRGRKAQQKRKLNGCGLTQSQAPKDKEAK